MPAVERLAQDLEASDIRKVLRLELSVGRAAPGTLHGCGLVVINPPFTLVDEAKVLLPALAERLATDKQAGVRVDWLAGEA